MTVDLAPSIEQALASNHRRLVVLTGDRDAGWDRLNEAADRCPDLPPQRIAIGRDLPTLGSGWEQLSPERASSLLGQGPGLVAVDLHGSTEITALCAAAGSVRGGGLLIVLCPDLEAWPEAEDRLRERLAPLPFAPQDVDRRFVRRLATSLERWATVWRIEPGGSVTGPFPPNEPARLAEPATWESYQPQSPDGARFDGRVFLACRTSDQEAAVLGLEALMDPPEDGPAAVVLSADRGRGKSSALGLAAHGLTAAGSRVVVTGPGTDAVRELQARVVELGGPPPPFLAPEDVAARGADVVLVDEAGALSVPVLRGLAAAAPRVAFATTVFGYEGTGMGFDVRFREHLVERSGSLHEHHLDQPIHWAPDDPVEGWARSTFGLEARPAESAFFHTVRPDEVTVEAFTGAQLAQDEGVLSQLLGLATLANYRTSPEELARILDGPDILVRCAMWRGSVVGALLLAHEGGLTMETCSGLFEGRSRLQGNVLPEALTCHLAEEGAGTLDAWRVLWLAVHPAAQRRGVGSCLLWAAVDEAPDADVDYVGAEFAATEDLLRFGNHCGFGLVRVAEIRSPVSGEHSAVVLRPTSDWGERLAGRLQAAFVRRFPHVLADALSRLDPPVALAAMRGSLVGEIEPEMAPDDWNVLLASAFGSARYDATVRPAWELVRAHLSESKPRVDLDPIQQTLLLTKVIQHRPWAEAAACCGIDDIDDAARQLRRALQPLILAYGPAWARKAADRFSRGETR